jgi:hypothetical protein
MAKAKVCAKCGQSTRGKDYIEVLGIRICIDCVHKKAEEAKAEARS